MGRGLSARGKLGGRLHFSELVQVLVLLEGVFDHGLVDLVVVLVTLRELVDVLRLHRIPFGPLEGVGLLVVVVEGVLSVLSRFLRENRVLLELIYQGCYSLLD